MPSQSIALSFRYYIWLADTIYSAGYITRSEINRRWYNNSLVNPDHTEEIPERTFHKWRHAIEDLFEINIGCSRARGGAYYIENAGDIKQDGVRNWLINTLAVNNLISDSRHLKHQILFEHIPSGQRFLTPIIEAMRDKKRIRISYQRFHSIEPREILLSPYCIKVFCQRWYLLGKNDVHAEPHLYALDRFVDLTITGEQYSLPKNFDGEAYFANRYGVSATPTDKVEIIRICVSKSQVPYFRTLPLHSSQQEVETAEDFSVFEYCLIPNYEFKQELHKYMSEIEILAPQSIREEFAQEAKKLSKLYNSKSIKI